MKIRNYTEEQIDYIKKKYFVMNAEEIARNIGKKKENIYYIGFKLGLTKQIHNSWTDEEIQFLKDNYINMTSEEISKYINHTVDAINTKRDKLKLIRNEEWSNEEILFLKNNFEKMTHKEIGEILNRTDGAIRAKCFDLNLYKKELPWSEYEIEFVKNNYMEMRTKDISTELNRTVNAIELKAAQMGMKKYPYTCNYHYFDKIDTEEKAYWLGFLIADGWINKNEKTNAGVVGCELQYGDIEHLKKFNKSISGNYKINDRWRTCNISKDKDKKYHTCLIRIFSLTMYNSLYNLGFTNDKSYNVSFPKIKEHLMKHFLRGYFDADGCFTKTNRTFSIKFITVSEDLNNDIINVVRNMGIDISEYYYENDYGNQTYVPSINKYLDKIIFLDYIYSDCHIYLDRKYKKYLKVKEEYLNKIN